MEKDFIRIKLVDLLYKASHYHEMPMVFTGDELMEELLVDYKAFAEESETFEEWASDVDLKAIEKDAWYQTNENLQKPTVIPKEIVKEALGE
jgi:hypothetical protein